MVCALTIRKAISFSVEEEAYLYLTSDGGVDVDKYESSTVRFESADPCNRRDRI